MRRLGICLIIALLALSTTPAGANHLTSECGGAALAILDGDPPASMTAICTRTLDCEAGTYCEWLITVKGSGVGYISSARIELNLVRIAECGDALLECSDQVSLGVTGAPDGTPTTIWCIAEGWAVAPRVDCFAQAVLH